MQIKWWFDWTHHHELSRMDKENIIEKAKQELVELTGFSSPVAIGINKEDRMWCIVVEVTEKPSEAPDFETRIICEIKVDSNGNLIGYEKTPACKSAD